MLHRQNRQEVFIKCASISPSFELIRDAEVYGPGRGEAAVTEQSFVPSAPLRGPNYLPCVHTGYHYYKIWWPFDVPIEAILLIAEIFNPSLLILLKNAF